MSTAEKKIAKISKNRDGITQNLFDNGEKDSS